MANYRYQVRASNGQTQSGVIAADSAQTASAILRNQGAHIMSLNVDKSQKSSAANFLAKINSRKAGAKQVLDFTSQLAVMIRAGISLRAALEGIADQTTHPAFKEIIAQLRTDVEGGKSFSEALEKHPKLFGPLYINMVRASEMSGSFSEMLDRIAGYIAQQMETRKMVVGASIYPAIIGCLATCVTVFLLTFVLPKFYSIFEGKEEVLPFATVFLMNLSKFMVAQWPFLVGGIGVLAGLGFAAIKTETGGFWLDRMKLTIPVLKNMFRSLYISRSLQTMGQLINAGVPMLDTLTITGEVTGNRLYKIMWKKVHTSVKQGKKIAAPLQADSLLPKAVVQMISAGEESGKLGEVLDEISTYYAKALKDNIKTVTGMIEPIMILVMGGIVGFIAMAIILPIFKMSQLVS
ncbi:MAG: type II secretion system protein F [Phycisphaeraceae bacterium]|nr:MAG: type II secretion system protein F [Phycisphaeraceae bacterium]